MVTRLPRHGHGIQIVPVIKVGYRNEGLVIRLLSHTSATNGIQNISQAKCTNIKKKDRAVLTRKICMQIFRFNAAAIFELVNGRSRCGNERHTHFG